MDSIDEMRRWVDSFDLDPAAKALARMYFDEMEALPEIKTDEEYRHYAEQWQNLNANVKGGNYDALSLNETDPSIALNLGIHLVSDEQTYEEGMALLLKAEELGHRRARRAINHYSQSEV